MLSSEKLNRLLSFDEETGLLVCEAGVSFADLLEVFVPKGWFPPVTPGTKFVSMGGALASDVHGKNHHLEGSFSQHVQFFDLLLPDGREVRCSRDQHPELFLATAGGMGLTGMILRLALKMKPIQSSAIAFSSVKARNLSEIMELMDEYEKATYTMAWIDCLAKGNKLGRSILMKGEHASLEEIRGSKWEKAPLKQPQKLKLTVPFYFPSFTLNPLTVRAFNFAYYHKQRKKLVEKLVDYDSFFYPLDAIHHWNRIYGKKGFTQYQLVVPKEAGAKAIPEVLDRARQANFGSFLSVLKLFGHQEGMMNFPMRGYTLTLDFPISTRLMNFLPELDALVEHYGGRVYLTKDVRMSPEMLARTYPGLEDFKQVLAKVNPDAKVDSLLARRLHLTPSSPPA